MRSLLAPALIASASRRKGAITSVSFIAGPPLAGYAQTPSEVRKVRDVRTVRDMRTLRSCR